MGKVKHNSWFSHSVANTLAWGQVLLDGACQAHDLGAKTTPR